MAKNKEKEAILPWDEFRNEIKVQLEPVSVKQRVAFARRCALHALPYLYQQGNMDFWPKDKRLEHAFAVFNALDYCHAVVTIKDYDIDTREILDTVNDASNDAGSAAYADFASYASYAAANAPAACAAYAAYAAYGAPNAAANAADAAYYFNQTNIQPLLRQELQAIINNQTPAPVEFDRELINNFEKALKDQNCDYWAILYLKAFKNNFDIDLQELQQRLNVPEEIKAQGAAAVGNYMEELKQGAAQLNESRILILGDKGAGKTCLARRLIDPSADMTTVDESTAGVDTSIWTLEKSNTKVRIWDFAGHTITHAVHQFFLSERCLYILVYDGRLDNGSSLEYWLDHMKNYGDKSQAIIVVNEKDQHKIKIPINKLKTKYPIYNVYYLNIADEQQVEELRTNIADFISNNPCWNQQLIPKRYYKVKEYLESIFVKDEKNNDNDKFNEHIPIDKFYEVADFNNIEQPQQLLTDLNALGISLWYPELGQFGKLVLNPEWISHGVYKIINWVANRAAMQSQNGYTVNFSDLQRVFSHDEDVKRFGVEHHPFLFSLIEHYELAYQSQTDEQTLIFPHLLEEDQPDEQLLPVFAIGESLMLEYRAEHLLPPNTISRFIVRHSKQIEKDLVWRTGVVLVDDQYPDTIAMVNELDRKIEISVKGDNKTTYIDELRETMNAILDTYKSDKPELVYKVVFHGPNESPQSADQSLMLSERQVLNHIAREKSYFDDRTGQYVDLNPTVNIYNIKADKIIHGGRDVNIEIDNSTTYNYQNCNFELQGGLNDLANELLESRHSEQAKQLQNTAALLEKVENCETPAEVKKSGVGPRVKRLLEDMGDKNSSLHKVIEGTKNGVKIAQDLAEKYNSVAEWAGLPQVPKAFLKK